MSDPIANLEDAFFDLCAPHVAAFHAASGAWDALSGAAQELVALRAVFLDVPNGGYLQFFCNHGPVAHRHAVKALQRLQAHDAARALQRGADALAPYEDDPRIVALWDLAQVIDAATSAALDEASDAYCQTPDWLPTALDCYGESVS